MSLKNGIVLKQRYRIMSTLGKGGQGAVYLCEDIDVYNQKKAIKQFLNMQSMSREERQTALAMFKKEGAFLAMLDHQGLPKISDKFSSNGRCYLVIDYVEGQNLETILKEDPSFLNEGRIVDIALKLCDILNYMHTRVPPIVFRDVKPENIILTKDFQVKLIDFGTARFFDKRKKNDTIQVGTVGYAAPEQYTGTSDP
ncbi:MAG: serine/threonine protein kinase, partial [Spirochaetes bacterium]|nr:serine/threonine protein kinase [Spirochaetota bacterium]